MGRSRLHFRGSSDERSLFGGGGRVRMGIDVFAMERLEPLFKSIKNLSREGTEAWVTRGQRPG